MQTLEKTIQEIEEELKPYEKSPITTKYNSILNNFHMHFPSQEQDAFYHQLNKELGRWNKTYAEVGKDNGISNLKLSQTREQFYQTIDNTLKELGISMERVKKTLTDFYQKKGDENELYQTLWNTLFPVYIKLRERGYSKWDLIN